MFCRQEYDEIVVGSGSNDLAAAITLQKKTGLFVLIIEGKETIGGGMRAQELTLKGFKHDACSAIHLMAWIRKNDSLSGIVHASSSYPVKNHFFMETIRINTGTELVLSGRRVISKKLKENNYNFNYPRFDEAIANMLNK
jgi:NAD dependent epimerase/dehydratase family enzyme